VEKLKAHVCDAGVQVAVREAGMSAASDGDVLEAVLDSWDRNNRILVNLLRAVPAGGLEVRAMEGSPTVAEMFTHMHYVRLVFLSEDVPETAPAMPPREWLNEKDPDRIAEALAESGKAVRDAVERCVRSGQEMKVHYDHPLLYLEHMIWHEGYHHGQIKLALKINGHALENKVIGPLTWRVWMNKSGKC
jgi:uncharacterized damage-inducible protein DinB